MKYTDLRQHNYIGDKQAPSLRCFQFIWKLKDRDITPIGQYMNYQKFSNLQFRPLLKNFFRSIHIDLTDTSGEKIPVVSVGNARLVLMFKRACGIQFKPKRRYKMVASRQVQIPIFRGFDQQRGHGFGTLAQIVGRTAVPFLRRCIVPAA